MNRLSSFFKKNLSEDKVALITYLICGDPDIRTTQKIMKTMVDSGVDVIELGIPFTDPIADGPIIQKGVERALKKNISLNNIFSLVKEFRKTNTFTPIVLMGYMNPIEKMGYKNFSASAKKYGVDGVLIVDLPPEESAEINLTLSKNNISQIFLASPTTEENRLQNIINSSSGYLYYVSLKGITGSPIKNFSPIKNNVEKIRKISKYKIPVVVGFGIKNKIVAKNIGKFSDGIIIGSSIVELIEENYHQKDIMYKKIKSFLVNIKRALVHK